MCPRKHTVLLRVSGKLSALLLFIEKPASVSKVNPQCLASVVLASRKKSEGRLPRGKRRVGLLPRLPNARTVL